MDTINEAELAAEQAASQVPKEEEVRAEIIKEYGFDEANDAERIDKLVAREMDHTKKLSSAIGQKIKHRKEAEDLKNKVQVNNGSSPPDKEQKSDLTTQDLYALMDAKVPEADIDQVREYANLKKISIAEALKAPIVKSLLAESGELRNVASAANVGGSKRSSGKMTDDILLSKASKGELPDNDADLVRLIKLRKGYKN